MPDKNDITDTAFQGIRAKEMGLVESTKQSIRGWANDILGIRGVVVANLITILVGVAINQSFGGVIEIAGGIVTFLGLVGLLNNARHVGGS